MPSTAASLRAGASPADRRKGQFLGAGSLVFRPPTAFSGGDSTLSYPRTPSEFSIICLSSQEWSAPLQTNRQQITKRAARRGHAVLFVETGGFLGRHIWRLAVTRSRSLSRRLGGGEQTPEGIRVLKLWNVVPYGQSLRSASRLNWWIAARRIRRHARRLPQPTVAWLYDPKAASAIGAMGERFAVYDCVDDYAEQAAYSERSKALVAEADRLAAVRSRVVFTTTRPLYERHRGASQTHLVPNAGDYEHFVAAADRTFAKVELRSLQRPVLGFAGNFLGSKVDFGVLESLATEFSGGTLLLAGPADEPTLPRLERLVSRSNVVWLGLTPYEELPRVVAAFDVALIPYLSNEYTRSCFPLKLYEYLAAGKPVVATGLPELRGLEPHVVVADGVNAVTAAVTAALAAGDGQARARQAVAAGHTWEGRTSRLLELVADELT